MHKHCVWRLSLQGIPNRNNTSQEAGGWGWQMFGVRGKACFQLKKKKRHATHYINRFQLRSFNWTNAHTHKSTNKGSLHFSHVVSVPKASQTESGQPKHTSFDLYDCSEWGRVSVHSHITASSCPGLSVTTVTESKQRKEKLRDWKREDSHLFSRIVDHP